MTHIQPIQTQYKGYLFRSRLEARWAVFFDALGVRWEYEKEGYELPGGRYLPDFWLPINGKHPGSGYWVEIKPSDPSPRERLLFRQLVSTTLHSGYIFCGSPWPGEYFYEKWYANRDRLIAEDAYGIVQTSLTHHHLFPIDLASGASIMCAFKHARSARFEFGGAL